VSAITISEERKARVDFTVPYFEADLSLVTNVELNPDLETIDDLEGLTLGAPQGTTGEDCANFLVSEGLAAEVKSFDTSTPMFQDPSTGGVDAVVNDRPASQGFVDKAKPDLRAAIDGALTEMMEDGTYAEIYEEWFGTEPPFELPIE
jgi:ABC-type amino acid transport substrate-binding protein